MADPSLFQEYMNSRKLKTPAFNYVPGKGFEPTEQSQKVIELLNQASGKQYNLRPFNSVMARDGEPYWGTGGGVAYSDQPGVGYVDPLGGTVHTVAHEGAHVVFPSDLRQGRLKIEQDFNNPKHQSVNINPLNVPRDTGQRLRYVHEIITKPSLVEETRAQGVAEGVLNKLGIFSESSVPEYKTPLDYPATFATKGVNMYANTEIGPPSPGEMKEVQTIRRGVGPLMERVFKQGYSLIR
jgi:hypothetical protein